MKGGRQPRGYTVVETLIFLAVSSALFVSAYRLVSGQQAKAEFSYGTRELVSRIQDVMNDVSTGYYYNADNFRCTAGASGPVAITPAATGDQGRNSGCIFIGRAIQFAPNDTGSQESIRIYSIVGRRQAASSTRDVSSLAEAMPVPLSPRGGLPQVDVTETFPTPNNLVVKWARYNNGAGVSPATQTMTVGFFTNFSNGSLQKGSARNVDVIPIPGTQVSSSKATTGQAIFAATAPTVVNPSDGVDICVENPSGGQHAILNIGGNKRQLNTDIAIKSGGCPA
ncbi:MAG: prepilin-type N-terminal cleavage/methylation protein [Candidatus Saccharibacteria bacterium]|nr:prepilin-type N-terminal cleavage/methylation protein [Candidatus Saccharibacteria bacterium]